MLHALSFRPKLYLLLAAHDFPGNIGHWLCNWLRLDESCCHGAILRIILRFRLCICWTVYRERGLEVRSEVFQKRKRWKIRKMQTHVWSLNWMLVCNDHDTSCTLRPLYGCSIHSTTLKGGHEPTMGIFFAFKPCYLYSEDLCNGSVSDANVWVLPGIERGGLTP